MKEFKNLYPDSKIWFAEKMGKRVSFITGNVQKNYLNTTTIELNQGFKVFLENIELEKKQKETFSALLNLLIYIKDDNYES